jgi:hypothetical protein
MQTETNTVIRRFADFYLQDYLTKYYAEKKPAASIDAPTKPTSSGSHPILKNRSPATSRLRNTSGSGSGASTDDETNVSLPLVSPTSFESSTVIGAAPPLPLTPTNRHAKFRDIVEIVEYEMRDRVAEKQHSRTHSMPLNDSDDEPPDVGVGPEMEREETAEKVGAASASKANDEIGNGLLIPRSIAVADGEVPMVTSNISPLSSPRHRSRPPMKHLRLDECDESDECDSGDGRQLLQSKGPGEQEM